MVLHRHVALLSQPDFLATDKLEVSGLEVNNGMVGKCYPVAIESCFNIIAVTLNHGIPLVAARDAAHGHDFISAAGDVSTEGVGCRTLGIGPRVGD